MNNNIEYGYLECQKGGLHVGECLNLICFDNNCTNNGIICCICKNQDHQNHKSILPQKHFLYQLESRLPQIFGQDTIQNQQEEEIFFQGFAFEEGSNENQQQETKVQDSLNQNSEKEDQELLQARKKRCMEIIPELDKAHDAHMKLVESIEQKIQKLKQDLVSNYEQVKQRIQIQSMSSEKNIRAQINEFIGKKQEKNIELNQQVLMNCDIEEYKQKWNNLAQIVALQNDKVELSIEFEKTFQSALHYNKQVKQILDSIVSLINIQGQKFENEKQELRKKPIYKHNNNTNQTEKNNSKGKGEEGSGQMTFSSSLKSSFVNLSEGNSVAKQSSSHNQEKRFVLSNIALSKTQKTSFAFQIIEKKNWIGIGIGIKQILQAKQFKFEYGKLGMGYYLISSNGYKWSHSKESDNIKTQSLKFGNNDIICCTFDPVGNTLAFVNNTNKLKFMFTDLQYGQNNDIHICAGMSNAGESIKLLSQSESSKYQMP